MIVVVGYRLLVTSSDAPVENQQPEPETRNKNGSSSKT